MTTSREQLLENVNSIVDDIENARDLYDWLNDQLNIECVMRSPSGDFMGAEILCCCGGPDIRVDTRWGNVEGNWGSDHFTRSVDCNELNDLLEELYI